MPTCPGYKRECHEVTVLFPFGRPTHLCFDCLRLAAADEKEQELQCKPLDITKDLEFIVANPGQLRYKTLLPLFVYKVSDKFAMSGLDAWKLTRGTVSPSLFQLALKFLGVYNQSNLCICGEFLSNSAELHHAIVSRGKSYAWKSDYRFFIHDSRNVLVLHPVCHKYVTQSESLNFLRQIYGAAIDAWIVSHNAHKVITMKGENGV